MKDEYIVAFSSFYKAAYAQEKLQGAGIKAKLSRLPTELLESCGYSLELENVDINRVQEVLYQNEITLMGLFQVERSPEKKSKPRYIVVKNKYF